MLGHHTHELLEAYLISTGADCSVITRDHPGTPTIDPAPVSETSVPFRGAQLADFPGSDMDCPPAATT